MWRTRSYSSWCIAGILITLVFSSDLAAQGVEVEPNQPCASAQAFPGASFPFIVEGGLAPAPDVDFFLFEADPFGVMQLDLEGASTGKGSLGDPFLGVFDSACNLLVIDDDSGLGLNSRLQFSVPADGQFTVGVTSCCDGGFIGGGEGTYQLTVSRFEPIGSISGRVVNETGLPLQGNEFPYAVVYLLQCEEYGCEWIQGQSTDESGGFSFSGSFPVPGTPTLAAGRYALWASASGYQEVQTEPFEVGAGEDFDFGDLTLPHTQVIGSINGRLVDSVSGEPVPFESYPYVDVMRCDEWGNCYGVAGGQPDEEGRFSFDGPLYQLQPGSYKLRATAQQYKEGSTDTFQVEEDENLDIGDFPLEPYPIQLELLHACSDLPPQGGVCRFSVGILNGSGKRISGRVWGQVYVNLPSRWINFQIGQNGSTNPRPQKYALKTNAREVVQFEFDVPGMVPDGVYICTATIAGVDPDPLYHVEAENVGFCIYKGVGGFAVSSEKETRRIFRELRKQGRK